MHNMAVKIQLRRDTATNWQSVNPILSQGELGLDTISNALKIGDGTTAWNDLDYVITDFDPSATYPQLRAQGTTAADVGLGNVTNESKETMFNHPVFTGTISGIDATDVGLGNVLNITQIPASEKGQPNGVATLNGSGLIPSNQLPSFVDDTIEGYLNTSVDNRFYIEDSFTTLISEETGKIYVDLSTNKTYRWSGSQYIEISASLVPNNGTLTLGTTGIATGDQTFTADQATNATFTVNVPGTDLGSSGTGGTRTITSSTGNDTSITYTASDVGAATAQFYTTTIATGNWSGTDPVTAVKTVSGILSTDKPLIDIDLSAVAFADVEDKQTEYAKIYRVAATDDDEITFYALEAPTEELVIKIKVVR